MVWQRAEQRGRGTKPESAADSWHLSCQAFHHSVQMENEEKTQIGISLRNPDAFQEDKQGSPPLSLLSLFPCFCKNVSVFVSLKRYVLQLRSFLFVPLPLTFCVDQLQDLILASNSVTVFR